MPSTKLSNFLSTTYTGPQGPQGAIGPTGPLTPWQVKTANYTAVSKDYITANTIGGAWTLTLPASPSSGDFVVIADGGNFNIVNLVVARNGSTIENVADNVDLDIANAIVTFLYDSNTWQVFSSIGPIGPQGPQGPQGVTGPQGPQGPQGATGAAGAAGAAGPQGPQGPQGATGPTGPLTPYSVKTANYTAVSKDYIAANTIGGAWTLTLPASPSSGDFVVIADAGNFNTVNLTIARNGSTIEGISNDVLLDVSTVIVTFLYDGVTWQVFSSMGPKGPQGPQGPQGATGPQGPQGPQGATGSTGATGPQGPQGPSSMSDGTATAPGLPFAANTATGFYRPAANTLGFVTASVERMRIDSSGNVTGATITNPTLTLQSENMSPFGGRNRLINGGFGIWQRATSLTTSSNEVYGFADRWTTNLGASTTFSRSTDVPSGFQYSVSCAGATYNGIAQRIESVNCYDLVGQTITVSFYARRTSGSGGISIHLAYANSPDNFSSTTGIVEATVIASPSSSWTKYSYTTSSVLPASVANGLKVILFNGSTGSDTTLYTGVQLERGTVATPFEWRPFGQELALCQRYYHFLGGDTPYQSINTVAWYNAGECVGFFRHPVEMRTAPTIGKTGSWQTLSAGTVGQNISADQNGPKTVQLGAYGGSGGSTGQAATLRVLGDSNFRLTFSAEL